MSEAILSTAQAAAAISEILDEDVSAKQLRTFLRSHTKKQGGAIGTDTPGKGRRYALQAEQMGAMASAFAAWRTAPNAILFSFTADEDDATEDGGDA